MRARIKVSAFTAGRDRCAACWSGSFPRTTRHERIHFTCDTRANGCAAARAFNTHRPGRQRAADARALAYIEPRFKLYLRFGEPVRTFQLDCWLRGAVFLPSALLCRIRRQSNDYGTRSAGSSW